MFAHKGLSSAVLSASLMPAEDKSKQLVVGFSSFFAPLRHPATLLKRDGASVDVVNDYA
jgi:hypothetical protein